MPVPKVASLSDAVAAIEPGSSIAVGLALEHAIPFAVGHELIRQHVENLTLIGPISDVLFDQLIGAGLVSRVRAAWIGNVSAGSGYRFREAAEAGQIKIEDHSNLSIALALEAGAMGVPYLPTRSLAGSDILRRSEFFREATDPFGSGPLVLVPAIQPDWAVVHVQVADPYGDAHFWGNTGVIEPGVGSAENVLVVAEEIVDPGLIQEDAGRVIVTRERVRAVVECPLGAHPSPLVGRYRRDHQHYLDYAERTRTQSGFDEWAETWIHGTADRRDYLQRLDAGLRVDGGAAAQETDHGR